MEQKLGPIAQVGLFLAHCESLVWDRNTVVSD